MICSIICNDYLKERKISSDWKKAHVLPVHKKGDKQCLRHYRPICLLPICSKIFERLIYNNIFTFVTDNKLISPNQSGLRPGYSCVNQSIAITHEIYKTFDGGFEVRGVFLDIKCDMKVYFFKWYFRKLCKTFTRVFVLLQTTSSSNWIKFFLGEC